MKFIFSCLMFLQLFTLVACTSLPSVNHNNRVGNIFDVFKNPYIKRHNGRTTWSRAPAAPVIPAHEKKPLYAKYKNECRSLRPKFHAANWEVRELGKEWLTVPGSERLSGRGRVMFARNSKASHKFTKIQRDALKQMKSNEKTILSQLPSYDASVCDTKDLHMMIFPPTTGTVL